MGDSESWHYIGSSRVNESENRIGFPDGVFEEEILSPGGRAHWAYEAVVGFLVVSNDRLEQKEEYKRQGSTKIGSGGDGYRATIPGQFFRDTGKKGGPVEEKAQVEYGETRHFVCQSGMMEGGTRSCYVLTREQLESTIATPTEWKDSFDSIPRFMRDR